MLVLVLAVLMLMVMEMELLLCVLLVAAIVAANAVTYDCYQAHVHRQHPH